MSGRMVSSISSWLKTKHITVPEDWVAACLDWISSENHNAKDEVVVRKMVYEQWLLTDLRDFATPTLPAGVKDQSFTLKGTFCVQIDNVMDVSQPKYSQLLQRQNKESGNTLISAETQPTQKPWEAKPTRMLMMKLTDGVSEVSGMEYLTIATLSDKLPPGTKVRIKGPLKCHRGVLMLKQSNIELLGGEVEDLFAANNYEAVLCQGLGRSPPSHPTGATTVEIRSENHETELPDAGIGKDDLHDILADAEFDENFGEDCKSITDKSCKKSDQKLSSIEVKKPKTIPSDSIRADDNIITISDDESLLGILDDADNDDDELVALAHLQYTTKSVVKSETFKDVDRKVSSSPNSNLRDTGKSLSKSVENNPQVDRNRSRSPHENSRDANGKSARNTSSYAKFNVPTESQSTVPLRCNSKTTIKMEDAVGREELMLAESDQVLLQKNLGSSGSILAVKTEPNQSRVAGAERQHSIPCKSVTTPSPSKRVCVEQTRGTSEHKSTPVVPEKDIRRYLCHAKRSLRANSEKKLNVRVKAIVITLLSKLNSDIISGWSLKARICDGTDMLDVEFSNAVLQKLIGFSVADREAVKQSQNAGDKQKLISGLNNCRETIISMCHFMSIEVQKLDDRLAGFVTDLEL